MMPNNFHTTGIIVPEKTIRECAKVFEDDPNNSFVKILEEGQQYIDAGMTPIYVYDPLDGEGGAIHVFNTDTFNKKLN